MERYDYGKCVCACMGGARRVLSLHTKVNEAAGDRFEQNLQ